MPTHLGAFQAFAEILNQTPAVSTAEPAPAAAPLPFGAAGGGGGGGGLPAGLSTALAQNPAMLEGLLQNPELLRRALVEKAGHAHSRDLLSLSLLTELFPSSPGCCGLSDLT